MQIIVLLSFVSLALAIPVPVRDPMINDGMFEGDILLVNYNEDRNAIPLDSQRWPQGVVPYIITPELESLKPEIQKAMKHIEEHTCIRFVERTTEQDYVKIIKHNGCYSVWGRLGREQPLSLGKGCEPFGTIVHELLHAIGFEHEHNRSDRDDYLTIHWDNIEDAWFYAFRKLRPEQNRLLSPFDFSSIMLYGSNSFTKSWGLHSMTGKDGRILKDVYDKEAMSVSDANRINKLYECPNYSS